MANFENSLNMSQPFVCSVTQGSTASIVEELTEVKKLLLKETQLRKAAEEEVNNLKIQVAQWKRSEVFFVLLPLVLFLFLFSILVLATLFTMYSSHQSVVT